MSNTLKIYTASAGSGKTYTIAREFIRLALSRAGNYRHIQAVTFTNKATEEMKSRILSQLYSITRIGKTEQGEQLSPKEAGDAQQLADWLIAEINRERQEATPRGDRLKPIDLEGLQRRASDCLRALLLDYGNFRISTIDSFFQEVLRTFARDLNLSGSFRLEIESDAIIREAEQAIFVDEQHPEHRQIMAWLRRIAMDSQQSDEGYDAPKKKLQRLSKELYREEVQILLSPQRGEGQEGEVERESHFPSIEAVERLYTLTSTEAKAFETKLCRLAESLTRLLEPAHSMGIKTSRGMLEARLALWLQGDFEEIQEAKGLPSTLVQMLEGNSSIFPQKAQKHAHALVDMPALEEALRSLNALLNEEVKDYLTARAILQCVPALGVLSAIEEKIRSIKKSNNCILLSDAPTLIHKILRENSGVPFLYERLGSRIKHHMIDEFQDTSQMQWSNFEPLLEEALSSGDGVLSQDSIIVGDIKQSIYRFRGSDSRQLADLRDLGNGSKDTATNAPPVYNHQTETLATNWRSCPTIVNFNNVLYRYLPTLISDHYHKIFASLGVEPKGDTGFDPECFRDNYKGGEQEVENDKTGRVVVHWTAPKQRSNGASTEAEGLIDETEVDTPTGLAEELPELIARLVARGAKLSDITILTRKVKEIEQVAHILQSHPDPRLRFPFISDEALKPGEALAVQLVVAALHIVIQPQDSYRREVFAAIYNETLRSREQRGEGLSQGAETPDEACPREPSEAVQWQDAEQEMELLQRLGRKSLYETVEAVITHFHPLFHTGELPHLIKLLDTALAYQQDLSVDIGDFLSMWQERKEGLHLSLPKGGEKIRLMTIHKSKGLDFPIVLLPYVNWEVMPKSSHFRPSFIWAVPPEAYRTEGIKLLPVEVKKLLAKTHFAPAYCRECVATTLDALNLLYVASTRAEYEMHLWVPEPSKADLREGQRIIKRVDEEQKHQSKATASVEPSSTPGAVNPVGNIGEFVVPILSALAEGAEGRGSYFETLKPGEQDLSCRPIDIRCKSEAQPTDDCQAGEPKASEAPPQAGREQVAIHTLVSYPVGERIEELREGLEYFQPERKRHFGTVMHQILSEIETTRDVAQASQRVFDSGDLLPEEIPLASQRLQQLLACQEAKPWFDGSGRILNERSIIGGERGVVRPDRVVLYPDGSAVVVDYKFGKERESYKRQIRHYAYLLRQMGYSPVRPYLWYLSGEDDTEGQADEVGRIVALPALT